MTSCEMLLDQGLRIDGRRSNELRNIECRLGVFTQADGSAYLEQGNTKVLAAVYGPHESRSSRRQQLSSSGSFAVINCQYSAAVFSTSERKRRPRGDKRSLEFGQLLQETLQGVVCVHRYPRSQIDVYVEVLQADGGHYCTCVNAAILSLIDAGIELNDHLVSCTASQQQKSHRSHHHHLRQLPEPLVDVSFSEQAAGPQLMAALLPRSSELPLVQLTERLHIDRLPQLLDTVEHGCRQVHAVLDTAVRRHVTAAMLASLVAPSVTNVAEIMEDSGER